VSYAYAVLSSPTRRQHFDKTGRTDESLIDPGKGGWDAYFSELFDQVTTERIDGFFDSFEGKFTLLTSHPLSQYLILVWVLRVGSEEELADVRAAYLASSGSIEYILEHVMSRNALTAEDRFAKIVNDQIASGDLQSFPQWKKAFSKAAKAKRRRKVDAEAEEAEKLAEELGVADKLKKGGKKGKGKGKDGGDEEGGEEALRALIQQRGAGRMESLIAGLEAKYGKEEGGGSRRKKRKGGEPATEVTNGTNCSVSLTRRRRCLGLTTLAETEPSEEEFAKIQAEMMAKRKKAKA
jgi:DnaJ family protein C protein 9